MLVVLQLFVFCLMGLQPKSFLLGSVLVALMAPWVKVTQMIVVVRAGDQMRPNFDYCGKSSWSLGKNSRMGKSAHHQEIKRRVHTRSDRVRVYIIKYNVM